MIRMALTHAVRRGLAGGIGARQLAVWRRRFVAVGVPSRAGGSFGAWLRPWLLFLW